MINRLIHITKSDMSRAEEQALEAYPIKNEWVGNQYGVYGDVNQDSREKFIQGYEQAEKDYAELIDRAIEWFKNIADSTQELTSGNVSHKGCAIRGLARRSAEYLEKHRN